MSLQIGTLAWVEKTGGRLTTQDKLRLASQLVLTAAAERLRRIGRATIGEGSDCEFDVEDLAAPTLRTQVAAWAEAICAAISDPWLLAHCHRPYLIGATLGCRLCVDHELFYAAAMLHDVVEVQAAVSSRAHCRRASVSGPAYAGAIARLAIAYVPRTRTAAAAGTRPIAEKPSSCATTPPARGPSR
jgi:hypothetical protein